jgi:acetyl-CoA C-acetyltransferase
MRQEARNMTHSWIVAGCRTPIGKLLGSLAAVPAPQLAAVTIAESLRRASLAPDRVDEVLLGEVLQAGVGQAPARQAALQAKLPPSVPALTINKVCGSGLKAMMLADQAIRAGDAQVIVAGGMESMSRAPHLLSGVRAGIKFGDGELIDSMLHDGLSCSTENVAMGSLAEYTATSCCITRDDQDAFSLESHRRAIAAQERGAFRDEIVAVPTPRGGLVAEDEGPRRDATLVGLQKLRPAFDPSGTVTAGNASQISDGAATVVVTDESTAQPIQSPIKARIVATATSGLAPKELFLAPVDAVRKALERARFSLDDIDLFEMNEAFASQCLACQRQLEIPLDKLNVHGGAIALGHPIGASGARVLVTLLYALVQRKARRGLAALCLGGGNAVAMIVERA